MTLDIDLVAAPEPQEFMELLRARLPQLFAQAPPDVQLTQIDGAVYGVFHANERPHVIAADTRDGSRAIFAALACLDTQQLPPDACITLLSPYRSPAVRWLCQRDCTHWQRILVISINGEKGLLIDTAFTARKSVAPEAEAPATLRRRPHPATDELSAALTDEEEAFFQHL